MNRIKMLPQRGQKTVFLDRDGVINRRIIGDYVTKPHEFEVLPGVAEALALLSGLGFRLAVVSNQQGIALGRMTGVDVARVHHGLQAEMAHNDVFINGFYICPHHRDAGCPCRKPRPGLLDQAHRALRVDWSASYLIGDSDSDILAGKKRGVTTIKLAGPSAVEPDREMETLLDAARWITCRERRTS